MKQGREAINRGEESWCDEYVLGAFLWYYFTFSVVLSWGVHEDPLCLSVMVQALHYHSPSKASWASATTLGIPP